MTRLHFYICLASLAIMAEGNVSPSAIGAPVELTKHSQTPALKGSATRTLNFPKELAVGRLYFLSESKKIPGDWNMDRGTSITAQGVVVLPASAPVILKTNWAGAENLSWLQKLKADDLVGLGLQNMPLTTENLALVGRMTGLRYLLLNDTEVSDEDLAVVSKLPALLALGLSKTAICGSGLHYLKTCKRLVKVDLGHNKLNDKGLAQLALLPALRTLDLASCNLTDTSLAELKNCTSLATLSIVGNRKISDKGLAQLAALKKLWLLDLNGTNIGLKAAPALKTLPNLHTLRLEQSNFPEGADSKMKHLLPDCKIRYSSSKRTDLPAEIFKPLH